MDTQTGYLISQTGRWPQSIDIRHKILYIGNGPAAQTVFAIMVRIFLIGNSENCPRQRMKKSRVSWLLHKPLPYWCTKNIYRFRFIQNIVRRWLFLNLDSLLSMMISQHSNRLTLIADRADRDVQLLWWIGTGGTHPMCWGGISDLRRDGRNRHG